MYCTFGKVIDMPRAARKDYAQAADGLPGVLINALRFGRQDVGREEVELEHGGNFSGRRRREVLARCFPDCHKAGRTVISLTRKVKKSQGLTTNHHLVIRVQ